MRASDKMSGIGTYLSGRIGALVLVFIFNVLAVKLASSENYAAFSILLAGASVANTVAGLGSQRLVPKIIGLVEYAGSKKTIRLFCAVICARILSLSIVAMGLFYLYVGMIELNISLSTSIILPFLFLTLTSSVYLDIEAASQSLRQQRLSRFVTLSDTFFRCSALVVVFLVMDAVSATNLVIIVATSQLIFGAILGLNCIREIQGLSNARAEGLQSQADLFRLALAAYVGGLAWMATAPPVIRLFAASVLSPTALAALAFVQSLGASLQRYTPGFLLLPFVEAQVMRHGDGMDAETASARLGLPWKIDLVIVLLLLGFVSPIGGPVLAILGRPEFSQFPPFLALVLLPIPTGTMYRSMEVAAVYSGNYGVIAKSSLISICSFLSIIFANDLGITFIMLLPVLDNLLKCASIHLSLVKQHVSPIASWPTVLFLFSLGGSIAICGHITVGRGPYFSTVVAVVTTLTVVAAIVATRVFTHTEVSLLSLKAPRAFRSLLQFLAGKRPG